MVDLVEQMYLSRVPAPEPPVFSGNPLEYAAWKSAFEALIDQRRIPAREKMHYLKKYISGKARECIEGYFLYTSDSTYEEAKAVLDKRFGDVYSAKRLQRKAGKVPENSSSRQCWPTTICRFPTAMSLSLTCNSKHECP